jgi:NADPH:quinone reductase-like Zn-dependent oxidoreductase
VEVDIPDFVNVMAKFRSGIEATMLFSGVAAHAPTDKLWIFGSEGTLSYDFDTDDLQLGRRGGKLESIPIPTELQRSWTVERDFIAAVRDPSAPRPRPDFNEGMNYMRVVHAVWHMRTIMKEIRQVQAAREDELFKLAKEHQAPLELIQEVHRTGKLPVPNFSAGGIATPADAALMMKLGAETVFVGSGIFKSGDPARRAQAIVDSVVFYNDAKKLARIAGCTPSRWTKIADDVLAFFDADGDDLTNKRLMLELEKASEKSIKRAVSGTRGGKAKARKQKETDVANATRLLCHSSDVRSQKEEPPTPKGEKRRKPRTAIAADFPDAEAISDEQGAALMLKGMSAECLLHRVHRLQAGETILVHAAAGGLGLMLCSWARSIGARVLGTVSTEEKARSAQLAGCESVIVTRDYRFSSRVRELTAGRGVDLVLDGLGQAASAENLDSLASCGHWISYGQASGPLGAVDPALLEARSLTLSRPVVFHYIAERARLLEIASRVFEAWRRGWLRTGPINRFALASAAEAHRALESRQTIGPIVLVP